MPCLILERSAGNRMALFTVNVSHLRDNVFEHGCEAISGRNCKIAQNCLTSTFQNIVMQMRKGNCEKGYCISSAVYLQWCNKFKNNYYCHCPRLLMSIVAWLVFFFFLLFCYYNYFFFLVGVQNYIPLASVHLHAYNVHVIKLN